MSNPTVSLRLSDYHLARALRAIRILEPNWQLTSCSDLVRTVFNDYIAKSEHFNKSPLTVPPELVAEIKYNRANIKQRSPRQKPLPMLGNQHKEQTNHKDQATIMRELEEERIFNEIKYGITENQQTPETTSEPSQETSTVFPGTSSNPLTEDQPTESEINTVTDFSLPPELKDQLD
jgi:hypothetical protein